MASAIVVLDHAGNARPPHTGPAIAPVITGRCWLCHGSGYVELGLVGGTNEGIGHRCANCAGTGYVSREAA